MEKLFLVEIDSLDNEKGCFASNAHFAELFGITKGRCSQIVKSLEEKKLVNVRLEREGKRVVKRLIRVVNKLNNPIKNIKHPYLENAEGINTSINNTSEGETALDFLRSNYSFRFEQWCMQNKAAIKDFEKFCLDFNDVADQEELKFEGKVLFARLGRYARNWVQNQDKYLPKEDLKEAPRNYLKNIL